jgi:hypothetical protein
MRSGVSHYLSKGWRIFPLGVSLERICRLADEVFQGLSSQPPCSSLPGNMAKMQPNRIAADTTNQWTDQRRRVSITSRCIVFHVHWPLATPMYLHAILGPSRPSPSLPVIDSTYCPTADNISPYAPLNRCVLRRHIDMKRDRRTRGSARHRFNTAYIGTPPHWAMQLCLVSSDPVSDIETNLLETD